MQPAPTRDNAAPGANEPVTPTTGRSSQEPISEVVEQDSRLAPLSRQSTQSSAPSFKRTMSNIFRRSHTSASITPVRREVSNSQPPPPPPQATAPKAVPNGGNGAPLRPTNSNQDPLKRLAALSVSGSPPPQNKQGGRRFSWHRSNTSTRSNTPPEPASPLEAAPTSDPNGVIPEDGPASNDLNADKKNKSATGLGLRGRAVNFVTHGAHANQNGAKSGHRLQSSSSILLAWEVDKASLHCKQEM